MVFGIKNCKKGTLVVTVTRVPAVVDGSNFKVKVRATKVGDPNDGKVSGDSTKCEKAHSIINIAPGRYRVTVEPSPGDGYSFDPADAVEVDVTANTDTAVALEIEPTRLVSVTPGVPWKQFINLELTDKAKAAGDVLVAHNEQEVRAAAALQAANLDGLAEWINVATQMVADAPAKAMDPKQMGRVLEVEATLALPMAGVKVYFAFAPEAGNPAWAGAPEDMRAGLTHKPAGAKKDKWETAFGKKSFALTDAQGKAKARFRVTRFGGDAFKVKASLSPLPLTNGNAVESQVITVWRKIWYQLTWNREHDPLAMALATADFEGAFIAFEAIDPRPFSVLPGVTETDMWQFDAGPRRGQLAPGQTAPIEAIIDGAFAGPVPASGTITVTPTVGPAVARVVSLRNPPRMEVTGNSLTTHAPIGGTFAPLTEDFTVRNAGGRVLSFTAAVNQPWAKLSVTAGRLAHAESVTVRLELDHDLLRTLPVANHTAVVTFTHPGVGAETVTKHAWITVTDSDPGALVVTDHEALTLVGPAGGPFTGAPAKTWTLTNHGKKRLVFSAAPPGPAWVKLKCAAIEAVPALAKKAKEDAEAAEKEAVKLEAEAKVLTEELDAQVKREQEVVASADQRAQQAALDAPRLRREATAAREHATRTMELARQTRLASGRAQAESAEEDATEAEERAAEAEGMPERTEREKTEAAEATKEVRGRAEPKQKEAEEARKKADAEKAEADDLKGLADRGEARLEAGASAAVEVKVKVADPGVTGALPARTTVTFRDVTGGASVERNVQVLRPGSLAIAEADLASAHDAGTFPATTQAYTLANPGDQPVAFTAAGDRNWITVDKADGTVAGGASVVVTVTANRDAANTFEVGVHAGTVTFTDATHAATITKSVTLTVTANPAGALAVLPWEPLDCAGNPGPPFAPTSQIYTLKNIGGDSLSYEVSHGNQHPAWLQVSSPGRTIPIGDHNKALLWPLRQQPANGHPRTVQLLICQQQSDPGDSAVIAALASATREIDVPGASVVNDDGAELEIVTPAIDGAPLIMEGTWTWSGHSGTLVGKDGLLSVVRGRATLGDVRITAPAACGPDCAKAGCAKNVPIVPTGTKQFRVQGLKLHGHQGFLGEGGYEDRPTCLIVARLNEEADFNDTVSHEIGHMMNAILHERADQEQAIAEVEKWKKDNKKDKSIDLATREQVDRILAGYKAALEYFWTPGVPINPLQYDQQQGNHCGFGGTRHPAVGDLIKYRNGTCILYDAGRPMKLNWCAECTKYLRYVDLREFNYR